MYRKIIKYFLCITLICSVTAELKGQEVEEIEVIDLNNLPLEDYANLSLPP